MIRRSSSTLRATEGDADRWNADRRPTGRLSGAISGDKPSKPAVPASGRGLEPGRQEKAFERRPRPPMFIYGDNLNPRNWT